MVASKVYIHIGYGRTGTSFLQQAVFPQMQGIDYLGKYHNAYPEWLLDWNYLDDFLLESRIEDIRGRLATAEQHKLISSEAFTQTGGIFQQIERIKKVITNPGIIIVLRNPVDLVISKYRYLIKQKLVAEELLSMLDTSHRPYDLLRRKRFYLQDNIYPRVIDKLKSDFGDENVLVLKYEQLLKDSDAFIANICEFTRCSLSGQVDNSIVNASDQSIDISDDVVTMLEDYYSSRFNYEDIWPAEGY